MILTLNSLLCWNKIKYSKHLCSLHVLLSSVAQEKWDSQSVQSERLKLLFCFMFVALVFVILLVHLFFSGKWQNNHIVMYVYIWVLCFSYSVRKAFVSSTPCKGNENSFSQLNCDTIHQLRIAMDRLNEGWCCGRVESRQEVVCPEQFQTVPTGLRDGSVQNQQALSASEARRKYHSSGWKIWHTNLCLRDKTRDTSDTASVYRNLVRPIFIYLLLLLSLSI